MKCIKNTIIKLFPTEQSIVERVSVQVSEYSQRNGGADNGCLFAVEVLFPDGKWWAVGYYKSLEEAKAAATKEAAERGADLIAVSFWPNCQPI